MKFYRVCHITTGQGLWYNRDGEFTGLIHGKYSFCKNNALQMEYDPELVGWLSATEDYEKLLQWFPEQDIIELEKEHYCIHVYETENYKFYDRFQHYIINENNLTLVQTKFLTPMQLQNESNKETSGN